jgi:hypothetical protein
MDHRRQCWFEADPSRFMPDHILSGRPEPHPALMNVIYLLGSYFAHSEAGSKLEEHFVARTLEEITKALDGSDRLVDVVQASCLLAIYFYATCRTLEGYTHSFSAAKLATGLGLHQITPTNLKFDSGVQLTNSPLPLPPPEDQAEMSDRINAFWQVFMVDRCWSVANGLPLAMPDADYSKAQLRTPFPKPSGEPYLVSSVAIVPRVLFLFMTIIAGRFCNN